jgi:membrane-associated phospholipid phosphatase
VAILDATFVVWIFISLAKTIGKLQVSKTSSFISSHTSSIATLYFVIASFFPGTDLCDINANVS